MRLQGYSPCTFTFNPAWFDVSPGLPKSILIFRASGCPSNFGGGSDRRHSLSQCEPLDVTGGLCLQTCFLLIATTMGRVGTCNRCSSLPGRRRGSARRLLQWILLHVSFHEPLDWYSVATNAILQVH